VTPVLAMLVAPVTPATHIAATHVAVRVLHRAAVGVLTCENNTSEAKNNEPRDRKYFPFQPFVPP
jgi:hypothetical protein